MQNKHRIAKKSERGQSFMELAVSIVFLLILLAAVIDLGWAYYQMTALRDTAQEAASYGTMCPDITGPLDNSQNPPPNKIVQRLLWSTTAPLNPKDFKKIEVTFTDMDGNALDLSNSATKLKGNQVHVSVEIDHHIVTPFVSTFIGTTVYPLKADVTDTIMVEDCP